MNNKLKLIWKSEMGESYTIGELRLDKGKYYFQYNEENVKKATESGFTLLPCFPRVNAKYFREELFLVFQGWLNERKNNENTLEFLKDIVNDNFCFLDQQVVC